MIRLAPSSSGAAALYDRVLVVFDGEGGLVDEQKLEKRGESIARFGDEWLVLLHKHKHLVRANGDVTNASFAAGKVAIGAFSVGRDDTVVVLRGDALELWSRDDEREWTAEGGPFTQAVIVRDHVVALGEDGALYFFLRDDGAPLGALRLASPEPVSEWRLVHVDGNVILLALGDWLVWIDASTRKTVRRVRARAKALELVADAEHVAVVVEDGFVQAFRSASGEPRASIEATDVAGLALGPNALFTIGQDGPSSVRARDRQELEVTASPASPICAIAARSNLAVVGDRSGRIRILEGSGAEVREVGAMAMGEGSVGLFLTKSETVIAAGPRVLTRSPRPWTTPHPLVLRSAPTAFAADEAYAFVGSQSGGVDVYDLEAGRWVTTYALSSDDRITALVRLAGAMLVVGTGALDGRVLFVDVADAKVVHRVSAHEEAFGVTCLATDARGRIVASGSDDGSVALLDPVKGRILARIRVSETPTSVAFEPSGRRLACVFADGTAALVTFAARGATVSDLGVRGATHVAWADHLVFGFKDGRAESGDRHVRPSERPASR